MHLLSKNIYCLSMIRATYKVGFQSDIFTQSLHHYHSASKQNQNHPIWTAPLLSTHLQVLYLCGLPYMKLSIDKLPRFDRLHEANRWYSWYRFDSVGSLLSNIPWWYSSCSQFDKYQSRIRCGDGWFFLKSVSSYPKVDGDGNSSRLRLSLS